MQSHQSRLKTVKALSSLHIRAVSPEPSSNSGLCQVGISVLSHHQSLFQTVKALPSLHIRTVSPEPSPNSEGPAKLAYLCCLTRAFFKHSEGSAKSAYLCCLTRAFSKQWALTKLAYLCCLNRAFSKQCALPSLHICAVSKEPSPNSGLCQVCISVLSQQSLLQTGCSAKSAYLCCLNRAFSKQGALPSLHVCAVSTEPSPNSVLCQVCISVLSQQSLLQTVVSAKSAYPCCLNRAFTKQWTLPSLHICAVTTEPSPNSGLCHVCKSVLSQQSRLQTVGSAKSAHVCCLTKQWALPSLHICAVSTEPSPNPGLRQVCISLLSQPSRLQIVGSAKLAYPCCLNRAVSKQWSLPSLHIPAVLTRAFSKP